MWKGTSVFCFDHRPKSEDICYWIYLLSKENAKTPEEGTFGGPKQQVIIECVDLPTGQHLIERS